MWFPQVMYYPDDWVLGWGLGLELYNHDGKIFGGHGGAMAGHLAGVYVHRKTQIGAAALTNSGTRGDLDLLCIKLAAKAMEVWPEPIEPWRPEVAPPAEVRAILGRWWSEGNEFRLLVGGRDAAGEGRRHTTGTCRDDVRARRRRLVGREGTRARRAPARRRASLVWAGYPFTRVQEPFKT